MPLRQFTSGSGYRYGFNGQEQSKELNGDGNNYTAEFWQYDSRLGRRWNVDPIDKEYESPYAAFGNNPIWNVDPNGADTAKYLSGTQVLDAIKIGFNVIDNDIKNKKYNIGNDRTKELQTAIDNYASQHPDMSFGAYAEFRETVFDYFGGLNEIAFAKKTAWDQLSNQLNNPNISETTQIRGVIARIQTYNGFGLGVITAGANTGVGLGAGVLGIRTGPAPRGPQITSSGSPVKTGTRLNPFDLEMTHGLTQSKTVFAKLKADIKLNGIKEPIKFVEYNGRKYVVDGHHRLRAAKELGIKNVPVQKVELPYAGYKSTNDLIYSRY